MRSSLSPPNSNERQEMIKSSQSQRPGRGNRRMNTMFINEGLNLQGSQIAIMEKNRFSNFEMRKNIRDQVISDLKKSPKQSRISSPNEQAVSSNKSGLEAQQQTYKRNLMTQRLSNRRLAANMPSMKQSETPSEPLLPRLKVKNHEDAISSRIILTSHIKDEDVLKPKIKIQQMRLNQDPSTARMHYQPITTARQSTTRKKPTQLHISTDFRSSGNTNLKHSTTTMNRPLLDLTQEQYGILSDDQCIKNNTYVIVETTHPHHQRKSSAALESGRAVFKIVSPRGCLKGQKVTKKQIQDQGINTTEQSIREAQHKRELQQQFSVKWIEPEVPFFTDGIIKSEELAKNIDDENDGFRDFIALPQYFLRYDRLKRRFSKFSIEKKVLRTIVADDFLILRQIYPRVFSVKNSLKGTIEEPDLEFDPSEMNQYEIFMVKSVSYLYKKDYDRALYFLEQGVTQWPEASIEFKFNLGLLLYLKEDFDRAITVFSEIYQDLGTVEIEGQTLCLALSVTVNLLVSYLRKGDRFKEILNIQKAKTYERLRLIKDPLNFKIQQILQYAKQQNHQQKKRSKLQNLLLNTEDGQVICEPSFRNSARGNSTNRGDASSITTSSDEGDLDDMSEHSSEYSSDEGSARGPKELSYAKFKKRGNNNFPLKNLKQLEVIKVKKQAERDAKAAAQRYKNAQQVFLSTSEAPKKKKSDSPKQKFKVKRGEKASFFNIENIQDTRSPDYILSMTEIINRLQQKDDIQKNKALLYQLQQLDEVVHQAAKPSESELEAQQQSSGHTTLPFPFSPPLQTAVTGQTDSAQPRDTQIDICMRNLEELRLELAIEHGGELQRQDPIQKQYKIMCNSIYTLLAEEKLVDMLDESVQIMKGDRAGRKEMYKKISIAKQILMSSLIKTKKNIKDIDMLTDDQMVEMELLKDKVLELKQIMKEEEKKKQQPGRAMEYMEKLERDIKKMLNIARKKQKERDRQQKQEEEDKQISINPDLIEQISDSELIETKSLPSLLKRQKFQELVVGRFKIPKRKYLESLLPKDQPKEETPGMIKSNSQSLTQQVLKKYKSVDPEQFTKMLERTQEFLKFVFETFGSFFIAQRTYCMSEFFDLAPKNIQSYFDYTSSILATVPLRFPSLAEAFSDNEWTDICQSEFIYNRDDIMFKLVSHALREPKCLEYLGTNNSQHEWQIEVIQKFNMLQILNYIMREGVKVFCQEQSQDNSSEIESTIEARSLQRAETTVQEIDSIVDIDSLNAIKDQYARLKYKGAFNTSLIDKLIGKEVPMFRQFNKETRDKIYRHSHLRTITFSQEGESFLDLDRLNPSTILVILHGNIFIQTQVEQVQATIMVEKIDKQKRRIMVPLPKGPPIFKWVTKQVLGPGMALPVQFLVWMRERQSGQRLLMQKNGSGGELCQIDYLEFENEELSKLIYTPIYNSLIKKVRLIQNVELFNGDLQMGSSQLEKLSPYVMFVMAALFKVQVYKMSEVITQQDDIPKSMFVILDGQAKAVYQDKLERKGEVCPYSRRSIRTDLPKEMRFSMTNNSSPDKGSPSKIRSPSKSPIKSPANEFNIFGSSPNRKDQEESGSLAGSPSGKRLRSLQNITFQNMVYNRDWQDHQPTKKISFNNQIEFGFLTEGQFIGSRVVLDEGALRNYIKSSKDKIKDLLRPPQVMHRQTLDNRLKAGFIKAQVIKPEKRAKSETDSDDESNQESQLSFMDDLMQQFDLDDKGSLHSRGGNKLRKMSYKDLQVGSSSAWNVPGAKSNSTIPSEYEEKEIQVMKNFLLKSQLSIVVTSRSLQAMVMNKQDKAFFHESVRKMLTEMIQEKNFIDLDRPIERNRQIDFIRSTQKQWEQFKVKYEVHSLRETFHQKYELFSR